MSKIYKGHQVFYIRFLLKTHNLTLLQLESVISFEKDVWISEDKYRCRNNSKSYKGIEEIELNDKTKNNYKMTAYAYQ